jgi:hypothetical protein
LFDKAQTTLVQFPEGVGGTYTIPDGVTSIADQAFYYCAGLTNITLSADVTNLGSCVFCDCYILSTITVDADNPVFSSLGGVLFDKQQTTLIMFPCGRGGSYAIPAGVTSIGDSAFQWCQSLTAVTIPVGVTNIGNGAFNSDYYLASITMPPGVINIGSSAFQSCIELTTVIIPASVLSIGTTAFQDCQSLDSVYFLGNAPTLGVLPFGSVGMPVWVYPTCYYLPGTTNWGPSFGGCTAVLWNPLIQTGDGGFGLQSNQFGFNIAGSSNLVIVVEACADVAQGTWCPVSTNTLINGSSSFSDPVWTNYPARFYRLRSS